MDDYKRAADTLLSQQREIEGLKEAFALQARISIEEFRAKCAREADLHLQQQEIERLKGELRKRNLSSFLVGAYTTEARASAALAEMDRLHRLEMDGGND